MLRAAKDLEPSRDALFVATLNDGNGDGQKVRPETPHDSETLLFDSPR